MHIMQVITRQRFRNGLHLQSKVNVRAQYNVGWMNAYGIGTLQDYEQAVNWYRKSADQGFVDAQFNLATCTSEVMVLKRMILLHLLGLLRLLNKEMLLLNTIWVGCMFLVKESVENMPEAKHWIKKAITRTTIKTSLYSLKKFGINLN